jgi:dienelactone hydrolase
MHKEHGCSRGEFLQRLGLGLAGSPVLAGASKTAARPASPATLEPGGADMGSLYPEIERLARSNLYPYSFLTNRFRGLEQFQSVSREKILDLLIYRPPKVDPTAEVVERVDMGDFVREKVVFSTSPLFRVPAYVHIPAKLNGRAPAIVDLHSHGGMFVFGKEKVIDFGRNHPAMVAYQEENYDGRPTATALVRRGYVVITIDAFMFGERRPIFAAQRERYGLDRQAYSVEAVRRLNRDCAEKESTVVKSLTFAGLTWPGIVFWDDIRTVDYLVTRPEVDPKRIGCLGISMGGYRSLFLAALDRRIAAGCVVGFMSAVKPMLKSHIDTHSFVHFPPGLHAFLDLPDVAMLAAPRPLLVQQCSRDALFPPAGMKEAVEKIMAGYAKAKCGERFSGRFYDVPHRFTRPMQEEAFHWFDQHLGKA